MIIDGTKIAKDILARAKARAAALAHPPRVVALVANQTAATKSYLKIKSRFAQEAGCTFEIQEFPETVSAAELRSAATSSDVDALLVQLPLPTHLNPQDICNAIPLRKDADVLSGVARAEFEKGESGALLPPVVGAIRETFAFGKIDPKGKRAVVIGEGWLVGNPAAIWLREQGASVEVVTEKSKKSS